MKNKSNRYSTLASGALALGLLLGLGLSACGEAATAVSNGGTVAAGLASTVGTVGSNALTQAPTVASGAAQTAGTVGSNALTQAPTVVAGAVGTAGTIAAGAVQTAGTVVSEVRSPGAAGTPVAGGGASVIGTPPVSLTRPVGAIVPPGADSNTRVPPPAGATTVAKTAGITSTPTTTATSAATTASPSPASGGQTPAAGLAASPGATTVVATPGTTSLPIYQGAQTITLPAEAQNPLLTSFALVQAALDQPVVTFYKLSIGTSSGVAPGGSAPTPASNNPNDNGAVVSFYRSQLTGQGWMERTGQLNQFGNLSFLGSSPVLFIKANSVVLIGVSAPLTAETIQTANLSNQFKPGDIIIMTLTGVSKINF